MNTQYAFAKTEANEIQPQIRKKKNLIIFNYNTQEIERTNYPEGTTHKSYICDTIFVRNGVPNKDDLIKVLIHLKYSLDDEIALINNKEEKPNEYEEYQNYRSEVKALVNQLLEIYKSSLE